jgi:hypothetical protein
LARLDQFRPGTRATQGSMSEVSGHGWPAALPKHQGWVDKISQSRHSWWAREKARSPVGVSRDYNEYNVKHDLPTRETPTPDKMQNERVDAGGKWAATWSGNAHRVYSNCRGVVSSMLVRRRRIGPSAPSAPSAPSDANGSKPHRETTDACSASPLKPARAGRSAAFFAVHFGDLPGEEPAADAFEYVCPITAAHSDANGSKPHREATDAFSASPLKPAHARPFVSGFALAWGVGDLPRSELAADALDEYVCPITAEIMSDPVCTMDGITYERITAWSNGPSWQCPSSAASCASSGRAWRGSGQLGNSSQARARASHTGIPARSQQLPHLLKPVASEGAQYHYL